MKQAITPLLLIAVLAGLRLAAVRDDHNHALHQGGSVESSLAAPSGADVSRDRATGETAAPFLCPLAPPLRDVPSSPIQTPISPEDRPGSSVSGSGGGLWGCLDATLVGAADALMYWTELEARKEVEDEGDQMETTEAPSEERRIQEATPEETVAGIGETNEEQLVVDMQHPATGAPPPDDDEEGIIIGKRMQLVGYTADWCEGCKKMKPIWDQLADEGFRVTVADIDNPPIWTGNYKPLQIPLTAVFDGREFISQWVGPVDIKELRDALRYGEGVLPKSLGKVLETPKHMTLCSAAKESADLQARRNEQGHWNWNNRRLQLVNSSGYVTIEEICAESWPNQRDANDEVLWTEAFDCWRRSPGHWSVANSTWRAYGRARSQGSNGIWYMVIIVGSRERPPFVTMETIE